MLLSDNIEDIKKPDRICSLTFVVDEFPGLFLHTLIFSTIHSRYAKILNGALSDFWHWLSSNILVSSEEITILQIYLFSLYFFHVIQACLLF